MFGGLILEILNLFSAKKENPCPNASSLIEWNWLALWAISVRYFPSQLPWFFSMG
jgi:hypothetical protein